MAYGIGGLTGVKEIDEWNSPQHWVTSDLQTALARGEIAKANALNKTLETITGASTQQDIMANQLKTAAIGNQPKMEEIELMKKPNPAGTALYNQAIKSLTNSESGSGGIAPRRPPSAPITGSPLDAFLKNY